MKLQILCLFSLLAAVSLPGQTNLAIEKKLSVMETPSKMKLEIWSDILCPFCYIGKRHLEQALAQFPDSDHIEIIWKSFQLNPDLPMQPAEKQNAYEYLAKYKGMSYEASVQMHQNVAEMARQAGLDYHFEKTVIANSFHAHRVLQLAKTKGLGDAAEEHFFHSYFTGGKDISDRQTLVAIGKEIGLSEADVNEALTNDIYASSVKHDVEEAQSLGVRGVPFFVFDRKYAVSGAQPVASFTEALSKSYGEWRAQHPVSTLQVSEGPSCTPDGECK